MVDKSNEYGYVPSSPTQAFGSNTGVFESNDIVDLINASQWSRPGQLELIETQTFTTVLDVDFTSIQQNTYNVHFVTISVDRQTTSNDSVGVRFYENGVLETASVYKYAYQNGEANGTFGETKSTADNRLFCTQFVNVGDDKFSYNYFYNLGDSTKYSFQTMHSTAIQGTNYKMRFGSGVLPQASTVDGMRFTATNGTMTGSISLYGIRYS